MVAVTLSDAFLLLSEKYVKIVCVIILTEKLSDITSKYVNDIEYRLCWKVKF